MLGNDRIACIRLNFKQIKIMNLRKNKTWERHPKAGRKDWTHERRGKGWVISALIPLFP